MTDRCDELPNGVIKVPKGSDLAGQFGFVDD